MMAGRLDFFLSSLSANPPSGTAVLPYLWMPWIRPGCLWCVVVAALELTRMPVLCMIHVFCCARAGFRPDAMPRCQWQ